MTAAPCRYRVVEEQSSPCLRRSEVYSGFAWSAKAWPYRSIVRRNWPEEYYLQSDRASAQIDWPPRIGRRRHSKPLGPQPGQPMACMCSGGLFWPRAANGRTSFSCRHRFGGEHREGPTSRLQSLSTRSTQSITGAAITPASPTLSPADLKPTQRHRACPTRRKERPVSQDEVLGSSPTSARV